MIMFEDLKWKVPTKLRPNSNYPILRFLHDFQKRLFSFKIVIDYQDFDICEGRGVAIHCTLVGRVGQAKVREMKQVRRDTCKSLPQLESCN
jgi:hypothetical protein